MKDKIIWFSKLAIGDYFIRANSNNTCSYKKLSETTAYDLSCLSHNTSIKPRSLVIRIDPVRDWRLLHSR